MNYNTPKIYPELGESQFNRLYDQNYSIIL